MNLTDETHEATLAPRTRLGGIRAIRYEAWLLDLHPDVRQMRLAELALPRRSDDAQVQAAYQRRIAEFEIINAELRELDIYIANFATLASRLNAITGPNYGMQGEFDRQSLALAFNEYLAEDADDGFWAKLHKHLTNAEKPLSNAAESGADPLPVPPGSDSSSKD